MTNRNEHLAEYVTTIGLLTIRQVSNRVTVALWGADCQPMRYIGYEFSDEETADACFITQCLRGSALQSMRNAMINAEAAR